MNPKCKLPPNFRSPLSGSAEISAKRLGAATRKLTVRWPATGMAHRQQGGSHKPGVCFLRRRSHRSALRPAATPPSTDYRVSPGRRGHAPTDACRQGSGRRPPAPNTPAPPPQRQRRPPAAAAAAPAAVPRRLGHPRPLPRVLPGVPCFRCRLLRLSVCHMDVHTGRHIAVGFPLMCVHACAHMNVVNVDHECECCEFRYRNKTCIRVFMHVCMWGEIFAIRSAPSMLRSQAPFFKEICTTPLGVPWADEGGDS